MVKKVKFSQDLNTENKNDVKTPQVSLAKDKSSKKVDKKKKESRTKKLGKTIKETSSELKKVNWPTFREVAKKTGVVLVVVAIFAVVLLGIDYLLGLLFGLLN